MDKRRIKEMADTIIMLKSTISPMIMGYSMEEWDEIKEHLEDRHSTIQGGSIIIDAMGGNSQIKELRSKFQCEMLEAIHSYAKHLHAANKISREIDQAIIDGENGREEIKRIFG